MPCALLKPAPSALLGKYSLGHSKLLVDVVLLPINVVIWPSYMETDRRSTAVNLLPRVLKFLVRP